MLLRGPEVQLQQEDGGRGQESRQCLCFPWCPWGERCWDWGTAYCWGDLVTETLGQGIRVFPGGVKKGDFSVDFPETDLCEGGGRG